MGDIKVCQLTFSITSWSGSTAESFAKLDVIKRPIGGSLKTIWRISRRGDGYKMRLFFEVIIGGMKGQRLCYMFGSGEGPR